MFKTAGAEFTTLVESEQPTFLYDDMPNHLTAVCVGPASPTASDNGVQLKLIVNRTQVLTYDESEGSSLPLDSGDIALEVAGVGAAQFQNLVVRESNLATPLVACEVLTPKSIQKAAGVRVEQTTTRTSDFLGAENCAWETADGEPLELDFSKYPIEDEAEIEFEGDRKFAAAEKAKSLKGIGDEAFLSYDDGELLLLSFRVGNIVGRVYYFPDKAKGQVEALKALAKAATAGVERTQST